MFPTRLSRLASCVDAPFEVMALESRTHLAVDFAIESPAEPDSFAVVATGEILSVPIRVTRSADPGDEVQSHEVAMFFSLDDVLDSTDVAAEVIGTVGTDRNGEVLFMGIPAGEYSERLVFRVPQVSALGSTYRIILRVSGISALGGSDPNPANNIVVAPDEMVVVNKFGSFDGRTGVRLELPIPGVNGEAAFSIEGAGQGEVTLVNGRFAVRIWDTDLDSDVTASVSRYSTPTSPRIPLASLVVDDAVNSITAYAADIDGPITFDGPIRFVRLGDITGPMEVSLPASSNSNFSARHVRDLNLTSRSTLGFSASSWQVTNPAFGLISAPRIAGINIANWESISPSNPEYRPPNFAGRIVVEGGTSSSLERSVSYISIVGVVSGGPWSIQGSIGSISVGATTAQFVLASGGSVNTFRVTNSLRGIIAVQHLYTLDVGKDILGAKVLVGTDLGSDGAIGGSGDAADRYQSGVMFSLIVGRNVVNTLIAAGRKPIGDSGLYEFLRGNRSRIDAIRIGNVLSANSRIQAGVFASHGGSVSVRGVSVDWRTDARFGVSIPPPSVTMLSSHVLRRSVLIGIQTTASVPFSTAASMGTFMVTNASGNRVGQLFVISSSPNDRLDESSFRLVLRFMRRDFAPFTAANNGTYTLSLPSGTFADNRGNTAPAGVLGTFTIAI